MNLTQALLLVADDGAPIDDRIEAAEVLGGSKSEDALAAVTKVAQDETVPQLLARAAGAAFASLVMSLGRLYQSDLVLADFTEGAYLAFDDTVGDRLRGTENRNDR